MSTPNRSVSKHRNQAQKLERQSSEEMGAHQTDNGKVGWDHQIHTARLPRMIRNHMYTRLYQVQMSPLPDSTTTNTRKLPCQLCQDDAWEAMLSCGGGGLSSFPNPRGLQTSAESELIFLQTRGLSCNWRRRKVRLLKTSRSSTMAFPMRPVCVDHSACLISS